MSNSSAPAGVTIDPESIESISPDVRPWSLRAECVGKTSLFFAPPSEGPDARRFRESKAARICAVCPVVAPCREWAREHREYGFWGGESEDSRAAAGFRAHPPRATRRPRRLNPEELNAKRRDPARVAS
jgi:WhiB family transcriptional regulator, redox-sensing transcriptional regulator